MDGKIDRCVQRELESKLDQIESERQTKREIVRQKDRQIERERERERERETERNRPFFFSLTKFYFKRICSSNQDFLCNNYFSLSNKQKLRKQGNALLAKTRTASVMLTLSLPTPWMLCMAWGGAIRPPLISEPLRGQEG